MGRRPEFSLTEDEIRDLKACLAEAERNNDLALHRRVRALLLVGDDGLMRTEAAAICGVEVSLLYRWQPRFKKGGVAALYTRKAPGRKPRLAGEQLEELKKAITAGPEASGFDTGAWSSPIIAKLVKKKFGYEYSSAQIRRLLRQLNFSYQVPKRRLAKANKELQEDWENKRLPNLLEKAAEEDAEIFLKTSPSFSSRGRSVRRGRGWA